MAKLTEDYCFTVKQETGFSASCFIPNLQHLRNKKQSINYRQLVAGGALSMKKDLLNRLRKVEQLAKTSKIQRLLNNPYKYCYALYYRLWVYPKTKEEKLVHTPVFLGREMLIALPASTDIYLTGGKSHGSEIRLARFLIDQLEPGDHFLDIGAHYGYFSLIAARLVGDGGKVVSFEPSVRTYAVLHRNVVGMAQMYAENKAVADTEGVLTFYEFPNLHSEYNSTDVSQFEKEAWYQAVRPEKVEVPSTTIDIITRAGFNPKIIKIDVEGAEDKVIAGATRFLGAHAPFIAMEYLEPKRNNEPHKSAARYLEQLGYHSCCIDSKGALVPVADIDAYLLQNNLDSDNIVFTK